MAQDKKSQLQALIKSSTTIDEKHKGTLLQCLPILDEEKINKLIKVFRDAQVKTAAIEKKYDEEELSLKKEYLKTVNEFTHKDVREAFKKWEQHEESGKAAKLEQLIEKARKVPEAKPEEKKRGLINTGLSKLVIAVILSAAAYIILRFAGYL